MRTSNTRGARVSTLSGATPVVILRADSGGQFVGECGPSQMMTRRSPLVRGLILDVSTPRVTAVGTRALISPRVWSRVEWLGLHASRA